MKLHSIKKNVVLVDCRKGRTTVPQIRKAVEKHFELESLGDQAKKRRSGFVLWGNMVRFYRMESVNSDIVVAAFDTDLSAKQTRKITKDFLGGKE
jgi:hypothetical protein